MKVDSVEQNLKKYSENKNYLVPLVNAHSLGGE